MEKENNNINWIAIIVAIIVGVVILGAIYFVKSPNNMPTRDNPKSTNLLNSIPVQPSLQSLQTQCEAIAKEDFDGWVILMKENDQKKGLSGNYDYASHYNKSMAKCIFSLHGSSFNTNLGSITDTFILKDEKDQVIGKLGYGTYTNSKIIILCVVNGQPCSSIEEYTRLTTPYLNN